MSEKIQINVFMPETDQINAPWAGSLPSARPFASLMVWPQRRLYRSAGHKLISKVRSVVRAAERLGGETLLEHIAWLSHALNNCRGASVCCLLACPTCHQHVCSGPQGQICSHILTSCQTETEVTLPSYCLIQSQYMATGPTSSSTKSIPPDIWKASQKNANFSVTALTGPRVELGSLPPLSPSLPPLGPSHPWSWTWVPPNPGVELGSLPPLELSLGPSHPWSWAWVPPTPGVELGSLPPLELNLGPSHPWSWAWVPPTPGVELGSLPSLGPSQQGPSQSWGPSHPLSWTWVCATWGESLPPDPWR